MTDVGVVGTCVWAAIGIWLGLGFDSPMHALRAARARWGGPPRHWPISVARPAYGVEGETWPSYIPPEPMTHAAAETVRAHRERAATEPGWREMMLAARNRISANVTVFLVGRMSRRG